MKIFRFVLLTWFVSTVPFSGAFAQEYNCKNPQYQLEMNYCAYQDYLAADQELNDAYRLAIGVVKRMDVNLTPDQAGAERTLREAQRAWIVFRDKACEAEGYVVRGGTLEPLLVSSCLARLTRERTEGLLWFTRIEG